MNRHSAVRAAPVVLLLATVLAACSTATQPPSPIAQSTPTLTLTHPASTPTPVRTESTVTPSGPTMTQKPTTSVPAVHAETITPPPATVVPPTPTDAVTPPTDTATAPPTTTSLPEPSPSPSPVTPRILAFGVVPTSTTNIGDTVFITWQAEGETAQLCPMRHGPVTSLCRDVPLQGSHEWETAEDSLQWAGFGLQVTSGEQTAWADQTVFFQCQSLRGWFFDDPPLRCPSDQAAETYAAGQTFEHGFMIWREDRDVFGIFCEGDPDVYGSQRLYEVAPSQLSAKASPDNRVGEDPPSGLYEPVSGFGMVWRGELENPERDFRDCLGWAIEPEAGYTLLDQCQYTVLSGAWTCYLRGPHGQIVRYGAATNTGYPLVWSIYHPPQP